MNKFEILKKAFDECGIAYLEGDIDGYKYLILSDEKGTLTSSETESLTNTHQFFEFEPDGRLASY